MKLYYSPGACSLAAHIALHEAGLDFERVLASTKTHRLEDGSDYHAINPKGYVPLLELDDGERLTEVAVILQYVADRAPAKQLAPPAGSMARWRLMEWLNFIATELHKGFSPLFNPGFGEQAHALFRERVAGRLGWVDEQLAGKAYLTGDGFSVADAYLYTVSRWAGYARVDTSGLKHLAAVVERIGARPAVQLALKHEGLS